MIKYYIKPTYFCDGNHQSLIKHEFSIQIFPTAETAYKRMAVKEHGVYVHVCSCRGIPEFKSAREQNAYTEVTGDVGNCQTIVGD